MQYQRCGSLGVVALAKLCTLRLACALHTVVLPTNQNLVWDSKTHAVSFMMSKLAEGNFCFLSCRISKPKRCYLTRPSGCEIYETDFFNYYSTWQTIVPPPDRCYNSQVGFVVLQGLQQSSRICSPIRTIVVKLDFLLNFGCARCSVWWSLPRRFDCPKRNFLK